jgi:hypothetical protein
LLSFPLGRKIRAMPRLIVTRVWTRGASPHNHAFEHANLHD